MSPTMGFRNRRDGAARFDRPCPLRIPRGRRLAVDCGGLPPLLKATASPPHSAPAGESGRGDAGLIG